MRINLNPKKQQVQCLSHKGEGGLKRKNGRGEKRGGAFCGMTFIERKKKAHQERVCGFAQRGGIRHRLGTVGKGLNGNEGLGGVENTQGGGGGLSRTQKHLAKEPWG